MFERLNQLLSALDAEMCGAHDPRRILELTDEMMDLIAVLQFITTLEQALARDCGNPLCPVHGMRG